MKREFLSDKRQKGDRLRQISIVFFLVTKRHLQFRQKKSESKLGHRELFTIGTLLHCSQNEDFFNRRLNSKLKTLFSLA